MKAWPWSHFAGQEKFTAAAIRRRVFQNWLNLFIRSFGFIGQWSTLGKAIGMSVDRARTRRALNLRRPVSSLVFSGNERGRTAFSIHRGSRRVIRGTEATSGTT